MGSDDEIVENLDEEPDESYLEKLYMHNRDAFKRDGATRKSAMRAEMRGITGMCPILEFFLQILILDSLQDGMMNDWRIGRDLWTGT